MALGTTPGLLARLAPFADLPRPALDLLATELHELNLPGGQTLFSEGDSGDALYVVTSGRLGVFVRGIDEKADLVGEVSGGETVGEMALLANTTRGASVIALRDSTLLRLSRAAFASLLDAYPQATRQFTQLIIARLERVNRRTSRIIPPKTFAVLPLSPDVPGAEFARDLTLSFRTQGFRVEHVGPEAVDRVPEWFHNVEAANDVVVYTGDCGVSAWTRQCHRQADCEILTAVANGDPAQGVSVCEQLAQQVVRSWQPQQELVLLHPSTARVPTGTARWLAAYAVAMHHHVRMGLAVDLGRLARLLTVRANGLVLSGGAAHGGAHVGVIRALREANIPIDLVAGTSIGAVVAACVAHEWDDEMISERYRRVVRTNPLSDYTLPLVALVAGRKASRLLEQTFGDRRIEDLWLPYFCISANLTSGQLMVHRDGVLRRALRASIAIPGVLPPVVQAGEVLVDGAVMNNFPVDVMKDLKRGPIIGVDVESDISLRSDESSLDSLSWYQLVRSWWRQRRGATPLPDILRILWRAGTVNSSATTAARRAQVDLLFRPPLASIDMLDWQATERAIEIGHRSASEQLAALGGKARLDAR